MTHCPLHFLTERKNYKQKRLRLLKDWLLTLRNNYPTKTISHSNQMHSKWPLLVTAIQNQFFLFWLLTPFNRSLIFAYPRKCHLQIYHADPSQLLNLYNNNPCQSEWLSFSLCVTYKTLIQSMENNNSNVPQAKAKAKLGKPPTRLQNHAPACLQLDMVEGSAPTNPFCPSPSSETSKAIPLLSPLVLSPQPLPEIVEKRLCESHHANNEQNNVGERNSTSPQGGWQHPAVATFTEPSTLFAFFQSQCMLVEHVQWHFGAAAAVFSSTVMVGSSVGSICKLHFFEDGIRGWSARRMKGWTILMCLMISICDRFINTFLSPPQYVSLSNRALFFF